jgi:putative redox protein
MPTIDVKLVLPPFGFEATDELGRTVRMDNSRDSAAGVSPMQGVLMSLGSCSGIDIMTILGKQRQLPDSLQLVIEGEREKDKVPALWEKAHIRFLLTGAVDRDKAERAAALSMEKYCSVAEMMRRSGCAITWEVSVNAAAGPSDTGEPA